MIFIIKRRAEIQAKYQKEAEDRVTKLLEEEEKKREEEEQQAQVDNKGGKKPSKPPAKKDPKKQQKEMEERRAQLLTQVNARTVQTYQSPLSTEWLYYVTLEVGKLLIINKKLYRNLQRSSFVLNMKKEAQKNLLLLVK